MLVKENIQNTQTNDKLTGLKIIYLILSIKIAVSNASKGTNTIFKFTTAIHSQ